MSLKIRKIANRCIQATGYKGDLYICKNVIAMYRKFHELHKNYEPMSFRRFLHINNIPERNIYYDGTSINKYYVQSMGLSLYRLNFKSNNFDTFINGGYHRVSKTIILNKCLEKTNKEYIKFIVLHEIGHHFRGASEIEADCFAEEWINKV